MPQTEVGRSEDLLAELAKWVAMETPTTDAASVNRLMDVAEGELARAGAMLTRIPGRDGFGDNLIARTPGEGKPVLVAGHLDTVWSHGTLDGMPYQVNGEKAHGPGIYDMKAGSFLAFHAVCSILRQRYEDAAADRAAADAGRGGGQPDRRANGSSARPREAACVLIPEPAGQGGACVTARKGVGRFVMRVQGRGAHSGGAFQDGASAVVELARQIVRIHDMVDLDRGITLNAAPVWGGSRPNVISPDAGCEIDLRVNSIADGEHMERTLLETTALTPGCRVVVEGGMNRPPYTESSGILALYDKARGIAETVGIALPRQHRGGGSDGNFTAAMGVPTLDGLGCPGAGAHASHEHILWQHLAPRAALMAGLLETLE